MSPQMIGKPDHVNKGEMKVYDYLQESPEADDWVVLSSLDISNHISNRNGIGELDFLIIIPDKGLLFAEVKGTNHIHRDSTGNWIYGNDLNKKDRRGPFKQANKAMYSLIKYLKKYHPEYSKVPYARVVIFPFIPEFNERSSEWNDYEVIDKKAIDEFGLADRLKIPLDRMIETIEYPTYQPKKLSLQDVETIARCYRPEIKVGDISRYHRIKEDVERFTEEQYLLLRSLSRNPRVFFHGPAGTGKTYIAIESAKRASKKDQKVLFVCKNKLLRNHIDDKLKLYPNVDVFLIDSLMTKYKTITEPRNANKEVTDHYWDKELPENAYANILKLSVLGDLPKYDLLIIDEAQDVFNRFNILDIFLENGISNGKWHFFGDFKYQDIYNNMIDKKPHDILNNMCGEHQYVEILLETNCRNTKQLVDKLERAIRAEECIYKDIRRTENSNNLEWRNTYQFYENNEDQVELLFKTIKFILEKGYKLDEIVVLSPKSDRKSIIRDFKSKYSSEYSGIDFYSLYKFKGMEKFAVICTDFDLDLSKDENKNLLYVAFTRSHDFFTVLMSKSQKSYIEENYHVQ
jgi:hypothetical protein